MPLDWHSATLTLTSTAGVVSRIGTMLLRPDIWLDLIMNSATKALHVCAKVTMFTADRLPVVICVRIPGHDDSQLKRVSSEPRATAIRAGSRRRHVKKEGTAHVMVPYNREITMNCRRWSGGGRDVRVLQRI